MKNTLFPELSKSEEEKKEEKKEKRNPPLQMVETLSPTMAPSVTKKYTHDSFDIEQFLPDYMKSLEEEEEKVEEDDVVVYDKSKGKWILVKASEKYKYDQN